MTATLLGRWQTRFFLTIFIGIPVSLPFAAVAGLVPFVVLAYSLTVGVGLDVLYDRRQRRRWDHDWPVHLQVRAGAIEFLMVAVGLLGCCGCAAVIAPPLLAAGPVVAVIVPIHWWLVWTLSFLCVQGPMRVLFPRWRFRGGRLW